MAMANPSNQDFWTVMLTVLGFCEATLLGMWLWMRRTIRRDRLKYSPPTELELSLGTAPECMLRHDLG